MGSKRKLQNITKSDYSRFTLKGMEGEAKVVYVYDGDTCDVVFYHTKMKDYVRFKCRLSGFDAPELDEPNGELTRDFLAHLCMGEDADDFDDSSVWDKKDLQDMLDKNKTTVYAVFGKEEKYGRALVTLKIAKEGESINDMVSDFVENLEMDW